MCKYILETKTDETPHVLKGKGSFSKSLLFKLHVKSLNLCVTKAHKYLFPSQKKKN